MVDIGSDAKRTKAWLESVPWVALVLALAMGLAGCAQGPFLGRAEPRWLEVRNETGVDIDYVYLSAQTRDGQAGQRYASISPVPRGASQQAMRPTDAPALPGKAVVRFQLMTGAEFSEVVDLNAVLRPSHAKAHGTLIFRLRPDYKVTVSLE